VRIKGALNDVAAISATTAKVKGDLGKLTTQVVAVYGITINFLNGVNQHRYFT
jgi:hypothetical protein